MIQPMRQTTLDAIKAHAQREYPQEACGFIVAQIGRELVMPAPNVDQDPTGNFTIAAQSYLEAARSGEILAVYHSHPAGPAAPSDIDRHACDRSALHWAIYSVPEDGFGFLVPGQRAPLLGRTFIWGVYDCWTLVYDYYQDTLGITLPEWEPYEQEFWLNGKNYYIERYAQFGFVPVEGAPRPHDVLIMQLGNVIKVPVHAGIYQANGTLLHHIPGRLSRADLYGDYLRTMTNLTLRHRSLA